MKNILFVYKKSSFKNSSILFLGIFLLMWTGCGVYSFTGADINYSTTQTVQVNYFQNNAPIVEPGVDRNFTQKLQEILMNQTNLDLVNRNGDLVYEGEITQFYVAPITATSDNRAAQNRLTVGVNVRFFNTKDPDKDFEQNFSFYYDYPGTSQLTGGQLETALEVIFERLTQDIFNASLANW